MKTQRSALRKVLLGSAVFAALGGAGLAIGAEEHAAAPRQANWAPPGRTVAYAVTERLEAIYQSKDKDGKELKTECPNGTNDSGTREQFAARFTPTETKKFTFAESGIANEAEIWFPNTTPDIFPFNEVGGKIGYGINLDGKDKPTDFTSPDGKSTGIDNQFYRAAGCILSYREGSSQRLFYEEYLEGKQFNRTIVELTDVDNLDNDDDVTVTTYRGLDPLVKDAKGDFQADTTQRVDAVFGQDFIHKSKAKIVNGVLITTQPADFVWPNENHTDASTELMHAARFELHLNPENMEGLIGGYLDVESGYRAAIKRYGSHQISYGKIAARSLYKALRRLADGYPDPATGENTAISTALEVRGVRVYLVHPDKKVAGNAAIPPA